jgi:hypothetical protein
MACVIGSLGRHETADWHRDHCAAADDLCRSRVMHGQAVIAGTRVPISVILDCLAPA